MQILVNLRNRYKMNDIHNIRCQYLKVLNKVPVVIRRVQGMFTLPQKRIYETLM